MSQYSRFEEEFHDGPQPVPSYEEGYPGPQPEMDVAHLPAQKILISDGAHRNRSIFSINSRLVLALISLGMVFVMCLAVILTGSSMKLGFYALVFAGTTVLINLIFSRKH